MGLDFLRLSWDMFGSVLWAFKNVWGILHNLPMYLDIYKMFDRPFKVFAYLRGSSEWPLKVLKIAVDYPPVWSLNDCANKNKQETKST